ncbi:MAG: hypothetical protein KGJ13_08125 [Patescibacteria group bacterium]|nr:hypothetical protein [Patescibacteria group bacterium]
MIIARRTPEEKTEQRKAILGKLEKAIDAIQGSDQFKRYLECQAKFHHYSFRNTLLIIMRCPDATRVAGYHTWPQFGRHVRKGESGIQIICPRPYKREVTTQHSDGTEDTEEVSGMSFAVGYVFDISQTEGDELPEPPRPKLDAGETGSLYSLLAQFARQRGIRIIETADEDKVGRSALGCYRPQSKEICIRPDHGIQMTKTLAHEIAHALTYESVEDYSVGEVIAESTAFVFCSHFGFDTTDYSAPYVAGWSKDRKLFSAALQTIQLASAVMIEAVEALEHKQEKAA